MHPFQIMDKFGLEGTSQGGQVQTPAQSRAELGWNDIQLLTTWPLVEMRK